MSINTSLAQTGRGIQLTSAGKWTFGLLRGCALLWLLRWLLAAARSAWHPSGLVGTGSAAMLVSFALEFLALFAVRAWNNYQALTKWLETRCTVLCDRLSAGTTSSRRPGSISRYIDNTNYVSILGPPYHLADGREMLSSGLDTGSRLGKGGLAVCNQEL